MLYGCSDISNKQFNEFEDSSYKIKLIEVEGGSFVMGNNNGEKDERPQHQVKLEDFYITAHEITHGQYCKFLNEQDKLEGRKENWIDFDDSDCKIKYNRKGYFPKPGFINHPVIEVTWDGAKAFCEWAGGRLPTEAEWEYAAKGGKYSESYKYSGADNPGKVACYDMNSQGSTHVVGKKKPNELKIYDMSGNVWEWCNDYYKSGYYSISAMHDPKGPAWGTGRVVRGGSWGYNEYYLRTTYRKLNSSDAGNFNLGFRMVKDIRQSK